MNTCINQAVRFDTVSERFHAPYLQLIHSVTIQASVIDVCLVCISSISLFFIHFYFFLSLRGIYRF
jgi:hypothetical protein